MDKMNSKDAEDALLVFPCVCGHLKLDHEWNAAECMSCDCAEFTPNDEAEYQRLLKIFREAD